MPANSFGSRFVVTTFGESHGLAMGVVIDGCPAGVMFDEKILNDFLNRRKPGGSLVSSRQEDDTPEVLSGVFEGKTLGSPIAIVVKNKNQKSEDYEKLKNTFRQGHADDVWQNKYGHRDYRGGGRASGRETLSRVLAGAVAKMFVQQIFPQFKVMAFANQIGPYKLSPEDRAHLQNEKHNFNVDDYSARFPSSQHERVQEMLRKAKEDGESYGGVVETWLSGVPENLGQPVFHKFKADLASAMLSLGGSYSFELGEGKDVLTYKGTDFHSSKLENQYAGVRGGITTGEDLIFQVGFKPTSSILDVAKMGRHDPCIVIRAIPVVEAMVYNLIADHILWSRGDKV